MASFQQLIYYFQTYGVLDFLLPFILVFTIVWAVLDKTNIISDKKGINVTLSIILALLFVVPHILGTYPLGYDPVEVLNTSIPSIALVTVGAVMVMILLGLFGSKGKGLTKLGSDIVAVIALIFVIYIFGSALNLWTGPYDVFYWWTTEVTELLVVLVVFGLVIYFITKDSTPTTDKKPLGERIESGLNKILKDRD